MRDSVKTVRLIVDEDAPPKPTMVSGMDSDSATLAEEEEDGNGAPLRATMPT